MLVKTLEGVDCVVDAVEGVLSFVVVLCVDPGVACGVLTSSVVDVNSSDVVVDEDVGFVFVGVVAARPSVCDKTVEVTLGT